MRKKADHARLVIFDKADGATYLSGSESLDLESIRSFLEEYRNGGLLRELHRCELSVLSHPSVVLLLEKSPEQMQATLRSELAAVARASHAAGRGLRFFVGQVREDDKRPAGSPPSGTVETVRELLGLGMSSGGLNGNAQSRSHALSVLVGARTGAPSPSPFLVMLDKPNDAVYLDELERSKDSDRGKSIQVVGEVCAK